MGAADASRAAGGDACANLTETEAGPGDDAPSPMMDAATGRPLSPTGAAVPPDADRRPTPHAFDAPLSEASSTANDRLAVRLRRQRLTAANDVVPPLPLPASLVNAAPSTGIARFESTFRSIIPTLIFAFLLIAAGVRGSNLLDMRAGILKTTEQQLALADRLVGRASAPALERALETGRSGTINDAMRAALSGPLAGASASLALADRSGTIVSDGGFGGSLIGLPMDAVVGGDGAMLRYGALAGVRDVRIDGERSVGVLRHLDNGSLLLYRTHAEILEPWKRRVFWNAAMFVSTAAVLLALLTGYFVQATRAKDADDHFFDGLRRMDAALGRGRCGLWEWEVGTGKVEWSRSMYEMLGLSLREPVSCFKAMRALIHPDDDALLDIAEEIAAKRTKTLDRMFRMRHADGSWVWLRARCELEQRGERYNLIGIAMDVTEQQELEERHRETETRLNDAVANISEAFVLWDADDRLVMSNAKFREWHGLTEAQVAPGTPRNDLVPPLYSHDRDSLDGARNGAGERTFEIKLPTGRWLQVSERRMSDGSIAAVGTDITVLKSHAERMRQSERRLTASIKDLDNARVAAEQRRCELEALSKDHLKQKRAAEAASHAKSEFMAAMSHELRTPLNAILGFSEMMETRVFGPLGANEMGCAKYGEYAGDIHRSASHLLAVIGDILDMSKIEAGRFEIVREAMDVAPLIRESVRSIAIPAADKGIAVETAVESALPVRGDERAIKQVLLNVLSNAVKFTPEGGTVSIGAERLDRAVSVVIQDTGIGIPRAALRRVAQPFEQVQNQYTRSHEGSGLGLAISRALAELHGGQLWISSLEDVGTRVTLRIPLDGSAASDGSLAA